MLKEAALSKNIAFTTLNAQSPAGQTEMKVNGCFAEEMPVVMLEDKHGITWLEHTDLFNKGEVSQTALSQMEDYQ
jgi:hypothetical protein